MIASSLHFLQRQRRQRALALRLAPLCRAAAKDAHRSEEAGLIAALPQWLRIRVILADVGLGRPPLAASAVAMMLAVAAALASAGPVTALVILILPPLLAMALLEWRARRNLDAFVADLPFFLDSVQQLLRVGNSLQQALTRSAETAGPAISRFLLPAVHRIQHGAPVPDSLSWAAERIAVPELRMFAAAVGINSRYGGGMSAILANLGQLLRHAARVKRELKAATAEARFSGLVLMAMPVVITLMITAINPEYVRFFADTPEGNRLATIALSLQLLGMAVMRRLMRLAF